MRKNEIYVRGNPPQIEKWLNICIRPQCDLYTLAILTWERGFAVICITAFPSLSLQIKNMKSYPISWYRTHPSHPQSVSLNGWHVQSCPSLPHSCSELTQKKFVGELMFMFWCFLLVKNCQKELIINLKVDVLWQLLPCAYMGMY